MEGATTACTARLPTRFWSTRAGVGVATAAALRCTTFLTTGRRSTAGFRTAVRFMARELSGHRAWRSPGSIRYFFFAADFLAFLVATIVAAVEGVGGGNGSSPFGSSISKGRMKRRTL